MRQQNSALAFRISLSALMAALGVVIMLISNLIPVLTYVAPLTASLTLIPVLVEFGRKYAWMTWCVTAALALLLCADREAAFFYTRKAIQNSRKARSVHRGVPAAVPDAHLCAGSGRYEE